MTDREALEREIARNPECDTLRLAFADWCDEHGDVDRAEFIRVQIELSDSPVPLTNMNKIVRLRKRSEELRERNPQWSKSACPECNGNPPRFSSYLGGDYPKCDTCNTSGDLLQVQPAPWHGIPPLEPRKLEFRCGFIDSVECTLAELGDEVSCDHCNGRGYGNRNPGDDEMNCFHCSGTVRQFAPSPWAVAVVKTLPVTQFHLTDRTPIAWRHGWVWGGHDPSRGYEDPVDNTRLPKPILHKLKNKINLNNAVGYSTREQAIEYAGIAACDVIRESVYGKAATSN